MRTKLFFNGSRIVLPFLFAVFVSFDAGQARTTYWITSFINQDPALPSNPAYLNIPYGKFTHLIVQNYICNSTTGNLDFYYRTVPDNWPTFRAGATAAGTKLLAYLGPDDMTNCTDSAHIDAFVTAITNAVNGVTSILNPHGVVLDGVDIDWEGGMCCLDDPATTQRIAQEEDLLSRLHTAMPTKILTMDVYLGGPTVVAAAKQAILDQINVLCYDSDFGTTSWYNAALNPNNADGTNGCSGKMSGAHHDPFGRWGDIPYSKLGAGMPFYATIHAGCSQANVANCPRTGISSYRDLVNDPVRWNPAYQFYDTTYKSNYLSIPAGALGAGSPAEFDPYNGPRYIYGLVRWGKATGVGGFMSYAVGDYEYLSSQTGDARYPLSTALFAAIFAAVGGP